MIELLLAGLFQAAAGQPDVSVQPAQSEVAGRANAPAQDTGATAVEDRKKLRCVNRTNVGSRIAKKVCTSRDADTEYQRESRDMLDRIQRNQTDKQSG